MSMESWKNVNNWHWIDKNCTAWSHKYIKDTLNSLTAENDGFTAHDITIEGDVDINQRKGKLLVFYDLNLAFEWKAELNGDVLSGNAKFPEISQDVHDEKDLEFSLKCSESNSDEIKKTVFNKIKEKMWKIIVKFKEDLLKEHGSSIQVEDKPKKAAAAPMAKANDSYVESGQKKQSLLAMSSLKQTKEFFCSADDLFRCLTHPDFIARWTGASSIMNISKIGSEFALFGGNIQGQLKAVEAPSFLKMKWRTSDWPSEHFSTVSISIKQQSSSTILELEQHDIPSGDLPRTEENWNKRYWNPIMAVFGFGSSF